METLKFCATQAANLTTQSSMKLKAKVPLCFQISHVVRKILQGEPLFTELIDIQVIEEVPDEMGFQPSGLQQMS